MGGYGCRQCITGCGGGIYQAVPEFLNITPQKRPLLCGLQDKYEVDKRAITIVSSLESGFSWVPVRLKNGDWSWLSTIYISTVKSVYRNWGDGFDNIKLEYEYYTAEEAAILKLQGRNK